MKGNLTEGRFPPRAEKLVREWVQERQNELMSAWERCANKQHPDKIEPLE